MPAASAKVLIFDCKDSKIRGLNTSSTPMALEPGVFSMLDGVRWTDDQSIKVRDGIGQLVSSIVGSATLKGYKAVTINGTNIVAAAVRVSTATRIYTSTDLATWTERTDSSTRFATDGNIDFSVARHPARITSPDLLVAVNSGGDYARVIDLGVSCKIHQPITADDRVANIPVTAKPYLFYDIQAGSTHTDRTNVRFSTADSGTSPNMLIRLTVSTTVQVNDYQTVQFSAAKTCGANSRQLWMVVDTAYQTAFDKIAVSLIHDQGGTPTEYTIYDPYATIPTGSGAYNPPPVLIPYGDSATRSVVVYELPQALVDFPGVSINALKFKFTAPNSEAPAANQTVDIYAVAFSGLTPGKTRIGTARCHSTSYAESPGVAFRNYLGVRLRDIGGPIDKHSRIPEDEAMSYVYTCAYTNPSATEVTNGTDQARFFIKLPGDKVFRYAVTRETVTAGALTAGSNGDSRATDLNKYQPTIDGYIMPSGEHLVIPKCRCIERANNRLFVGAIDATEQPSGVYASQFGNDFHFLRIPDYSAYGERTATSIELRGETVQRLAVVATSTYGAASVYTLTNKSLYVFQGSNASSIADISYIGPHGTLSPRSVAVHKAGLYWVDNECQVCALVGGEVIGLSRLIVDSELINSERKTDIACACWKDRLYVAYTPDGGSLNTCVLVYSLTLGVWEARDTMTSLFDVAGMLQFSLSNEPILVSLSNVARVMQYDKPGQTTDHGTAISVNIQTGYLHSLVDSKLDPFGEMILERANFVIDRGGTNTWSSVRIYQPGGGSRTYTLTATSGSGIGFLFDVPTSISGTARGKLCQLSLTGNITGGKRIYRIEVEVRKSSGGPANA